MQGHIIYDAVGLVGRHLDPVSLAHEVIGLDLQTGDEGEKGVMENQDQNRRDRTKTTNKTTGDLPVICEAVRITPMTIVSSLPRSR